MNKPTPGPWVLQYCGIEGVAFCCGIGPSEEDDANAALIVAAVNSCFAINPSNPLAVAEGLPELVNACRESLAYLRDPNGWEKAHTPKHEYLPNMLEDALAKLEAK